MKLLAVARRPLSIVELAWAVALAVAGPDVTTIASLAQLVDHQRILELIHPFITRIDFGDVKKRQIRLVHQSVKEYINNDYKSDQPRRRDPTIQTANKQELVGRSIEHLEAFILDICIRYLLLDDVNQIYIFSDEQVAIDELPQEFDLFSDDTEPIDYTVRCTWEEWEKDMIRYDPTERGLGELFVYASVNWLDHFSAIKVGALPSLASIESLCQAGSMRLRNWTQQNRRPDCVINARFPFDSKLYDPLSITSLYGSEAMLCHMLENADFDKPHHLPLAATGATNQVLQWGDLARLRILLLEGKFGYQLQNLDFFRLIMSQWSSPSTRHHNWDLAFDLIDYIFDTLVEDRCTNELMCMAARAGCMPLVQRLMIRTQHEKALRTDLLCGIRREREFPSCGKPGHQSIGEAVLGNHAGVVEYLLGQEGIEVHLHYLNSYGENVLHLAAKRCSPIMFRLLVPHFLEGRCQKDNQGDTALVRVIMSPSNSQDRCESARILLSQGDANGSTHFWAEHQDPLQMAVRLGDLDMCRLLIEIGHVNPLSALTRGLNGQMVLKDVSSLDEEVAPAILRFLNKHAMTASIMA